MGSASAPPKRAPPRNPAPKPNTKPRPHTCDTSVPAAFLIASASANGMADATLEAATKPAASTAATDMFSIRLDIGFLRFFRASASVHRIAEAHTATRPIVRVICDRNSARQADRFDETNQLGRIK